MNVWYGVRRNLGIFPVFVIYNRFGPRERYVSYLGRDSFRIQRGIRFGSRDRFVLDLERDSIRS